MASGLENCSTYCYVASCLSESEVSCKHESYGVDILRGSTTVANVLNLCLDFNTAKQYICDGNKVAYVYKSCGSNEVCTSGSCVQIYAPACYEMNGGDIHQVSGVAVNTQSSVFTTSENYCFNEKMLGQYRCDGTTSKFDYVTCPNDEKCDGGVCVYNYTCTETLPEQGVSAGKVSLYDGKNPVRSETDVCTGDSSTVRQVSCDKSGRIVYTNARCPYGTSCDSSSGVCK
jgi:hypothetical protein